MSFGPSTIVTICFTKSELKKNSATDDDLTHTSGFFVLSFGRGGLVSGHSFKCECVWGGWGVGGGGTRSLTSR